jgi:hypothetical protein
MENEKKYLDESIKIKERIRLKREADERMMNPFNVFDPNNFEPLLNDSEKEISYRKRVKPSKKLPTYGLNPKEILEGQMIGMYESKQDIYLILAHRCNDLQEEIDILKKRLQKLEKTV